MSFRIGRGHESAPTAANHTGLILTGAMPAKPAWYGRLDSIIEELRPLPFVSRATVERLLGVGRRRAQQILLPCLPLRVGSSNLADRDVLIERLKCISVADGDFEKHRRERVSAIVEKERARPRLLVESPVSVMNTRIENLPEGVTLEPGRIVVTFDTSEQALQKLLALAMAAGNDLGRFEDAIRTATN